MKIVRITLPLPPNMANARGKHWAKKAREQKDYKLRCTVAHHERLPEPMDMAVVHVHVRCWNLFDDDNLRALLKYPIDWLVDREFLIDDHPSCMKLGRVTQEIDRKNQGLEITLESV